MKNKSIRDKLAYSIACQVRSALHYKLVELKTPIRRLWPYFEHLKAGERILGCATKTEYCERFLHVKLRSVQYMLAGGNPLNKPREIISPGNVFKDTLRVLSRDYSELMLGCVSAFLEELHRRPAEGRDAGYVREIYDLARERQNWWAELADRTEPYVVPQEESCLTAPR
jgi:hypothetical protein